MGRELRGLAGAVMISGILFTVPAGAAGPSASDTVDGAAVGDKFYVGYLQGLLDSYETVNYYLAQLNDVNLLYCKPGGLVLTLDQARDIFSRYVEKHPIEGGFAIKAVILVAFKDVFPCPSAKP